MIIQYISKNALFVCSFPHIATFLLAEKLTKNKEK